MQTEKCNEYESHDRKIKLIALDLDGTTFNSRNELTDRTVNTLERVAEQGVYVVISTGRSFNSLPDTIKAVNGISYAITSNGAHINEIRSGKSLYDSCLDGAAVDAVINLTREIDVRIEIFIGGQAYIDEEYYNDIKANGTPYRNAEYVLWSREPVKDIYLLSKEHRHEIENINILFEGADHLEKHREKVEKIPDATITTSFINNLEVGGANTSKRTALIELISRLGINADEVMCCGDAPNDIQMIEFAGLGIAMGNAWGGTKDHADYVTLSNDEDGVAAAIEKFVLNK